MTADEKLTDRDAFVPAWSDEEMVLFFQWGQYQYSRQSLLDWLDQSLDTRERTSE